MLPSLANGKAFVLCLCQSLCWVFGHSYRASSLVAHCSPFASSPTSTHCSAVTLILSKDCLQADLLSSLKHFPLWYSVLWLQVALVSQILNSVSLTQSCQALFRLSFHLLWPGSSLTSIVLLFGFLFVCFGSLRPEGKSGGSCCIFAENESLNVLKAFLTNKYCAWDWKIYINAILKEHVICLENWLGEHRNSSSL